MLPVFPLKFRGLLDNVFSFFSSFFLQRVCIACYAKRCISHDRFRLSDHLSVCHSPVSCQNNLIYDHAVFTSI